MFRYVYDLSLNIAAVLDEEGEIVYVDPEGRTSSESNFVSSAAAATCLFEYDAFGNNLYRATPNRPNSETSMSIAWNEIFPRHLAGKEWDPEARLYYFGYRWYEPQQGVFVSRSPLGPLAEETYLYCHGDPVNYFDTNGMYPYPISTYSYTPPPKDAKEMVFTVIPEENPCNPWFWFWHLDNTRNVGFATGLDARMMRDNVRTGLTYEAVFEVEFLGFWPINIVSYDGGLYMPVAGVQARPAKGGGAPYESLLGGWGASLDIIFPLIPILIKIVVI